MAKKSVTKDDLDLLEELGETPEVEEEREYTAEEERVLAGFEEIESFYEEHQRQPLHGEERDIFERLYAVRLDRIRENKEARELLQNRDRFALLTAEVEDDLSDEALLDALSEGEKEEERLDSLVHVRSHEEKKAAEEIAQRTPCETFEIFAPIFENSRADLENGSRVAIKISTVNFRGINEGDLFILGGQIAYVAEKGEEFISEYDRADHRLRIIYDNQTESDLLLRSLQKALQQDETSRRITTKDHGPLFSKAPSDDDISTGYIYVLRSHSDHPYIAKNRTLIHKIGVTKGAVEKRIANAKKDPTFLFADVEIVASYQLSNLTPNKLENLLHQFFSEARLALNFEDPLRGKIKPNEWFLVPLDQIQSAIDKLISNNLNLYRYDVASALVVKD